jgi:hypothetical protein
MKSALCAALALLLLTGMANAADRDVIASAHAAYYRAAQRGLKDFTCQLSPNWEVVLADTAATNPEGARNAVAKLKQIQFTVHAGPGLKTEITHNTVRAENDEMATGLAQIYSGMEQMVTGFFDTYSLFMFYVPLPEPDSAYVLQKVADQWSLTYTEGKDTHVATTMAGNFAISSMHVDTPAFKSNIQPLFTANGEGLILTAYQADYDSGNPDEKTVLQVHIEHQMVSGIQLPKTLNLTGTYGTSAFGVIVSFSGCQANRA